MLCFAWELMFVAKINLPIPITILEGRFVLNFTIELLWELPHTELAIFNIIYFYWRNKFFSWWKTWPKVNPCVVIRTGQKTCDLVVHCWDKRPLKSKKSWASVNKRTFERGIQTQPQSFYITNFHIFDYLEGVKILILEEGVQSLHICYVFIDFCQHQ